MFYNNATLFLPLWRGARALNTDGTVNYDLHTHTRLFIVIFDMLSLENFSHFQALSPVGAPSQITILCGLKMLTLN
jgi:hypothetical protein